MATGADPDGSPVDEIGELPMVLADVPPAVQRRLAEWAAAATPGLSEPEIPPAVRPFAGFTAAKRARLGADALLDALQHRPAFRAAVVEWTRNNRPQRGDAVSAAAAALLLGDRAAGELVESIGRRGADTALRRERDEALARLERLEAELVRVRTELALAQQAGGQATAAEAERLRGRLREQGARLRQAHDELTERDAAHAAELAWLREQLAAAQAEAAKERSRAGTAVRRAEELDGALQQARRAARQDRQADDVRLALLLETLSGAAAGLRRELGLAMDAAAAPRPADLLASTAGGPAAGSVTDTASLDRLLALDGVHLVVDGYNVTKTGYPQLTLSEQRSRLVSQLGAVAARTGAEVTVVFDGAAVTTATSAPRGVRVLFSAPGVLADDVIRDVVGAEPAGRPVLVVTSDREVVLSVRAAGAHTAPSAVLLERLGRI